MKEENKSRQSCKGGRPPKSIKRDQHLAVKCSALERRLIERKAAAVQLTVSEYLRGVGLECKVTHTIRALPPEVLLFSATLGHIASNLNQMAYRRNSGVDLDFLERTRLNELSEELKTLVVHIKNYLQ